MYYFDDFVVNQVDPIRVPQLVRRLCCRGGVGEGVAASAGGPWEGMSSEAGSRGLFRKGPPELRYFRERRETTEGKAGCV